MKASTRTIIYSLMGGFLLGQVFTLTFIGAYRSLPLEDHSSDDAPRYPEAEEYSRPQRGGRARARRVKSSELPYKCGMVFSYHVPSTGGATITKWLERYTVLRNGTAKFFTNWGRDPVDGSGVPQVQQVFINGSKRYGTKRGVGMNRFVKGFDSDEWRVVHCHHSNLHLNVSEGLLSRWRSEVESQGCAFIAAVMFREPLGHALSLYKHVERFNSSRDVWAEHLDTRSGTGHWQTQLDYFLYNILARNPDGVDREAKVRRALGLLRDHFDIATVGEHDRFKRELLEMTGWEEKAMLRRNTHAGRLVFEKGEVEKLQKLLENNRDIEFIHEVKSMYGTSMAGSAGAG